MWEGIISLKKQGRHKEWGGGVKNQREIKGREIIWNLSMSRLAWIQLLITRFSFKFMKTKPIQFRFCIYTFELFDKGS